MGPAAAVVCGKLYLSKELNKVTAEFETQDVVLVIVRIILICRNFSYVFCHCLFLSIYMRNTSYLSISLMIVLNRIFDAGFYS